MSVASLFNQGAAAYDASRRKYIACFDDFYRIAVEQIPYPADAPFRVLDLGAGTGLLAAKVRQQFPHCQLTLSDFSSEMLAQAKQRFADAAAVEYQLCDYIAQPIEGQYDVIVSGLSLHHSSEPQWQRVAEKIFTALKPGGLFINADQILGRTPEIEAVYAERWLEQAHRNHCSDAEIQVALERMTEDKTLTLSTQFRLLEQAGFCALNCWYQFYRYAVYSAVKPRD